MKNLRMREKVPRTLGAVLQRRNIAARAVAGRVAK
jgi:hypothetical protein